jgi:hypothetical protein
VRKTAILFLAIVVTPVAFGDEIGHVLGVDGGYTLLVDDRSVAGLNLHGAVATVSYGYVVADRSYGQTVLGLVGGYGVLGGDQSLSRLIYGAEYMHLLLPGRPVTILANYGLLFNLVRTADRDRFAFAHHSRLQTGIGLDLPGGAILALALDYNFVGFPYYELSDSRVQYFGAALRYLRRF